MSKIKYPHNCLRHQLSYDEKKRFNSYKKRECERRRRYRVNGKTNHRYFYLHRCEFCWKFYTNVHLLYGYTICEQCPFDISKIETLFKQNNNTDLLLKISKGNIRNQLLISPTTTSNQSLTQFHDNPTEDTPCLFEDYEMKEFENALYIIQLNADWDSLYLHTLHQNCPQSLEDFTSDGITTLMKNFTFSKQNVERI